MLNQRCVPARGYYMSAHLLLNLLNELGKRNKKKYEACPYKSMLYG